MKLPGTEPEILAEWAKAGNEVVDRINAATKRDDIIQAIHDLMGRIVQSGNSLKCLYDHSEHEWVWDGAAILRVVYDTMIQGLFILESNSQERARRFLDFAAIEHRRAVQVIDAGETDMARQLAASPKRAAVEAAHNAEFDRVCKLYAIKPAKKLPREWFANLETLASQAEIVGYGPEYKFVYPQLCGATHSSSFVIRRDRPFPYSPFHLVHFGNLFAYRLLAKLAEYAGVALTEDEELMVVIARQNVCDR
jgi:hypothetical protein